MQLETRRFGHELAALCCASTMLACVSVDFTSDTKEETKPAEMLRGVVESTSGDALEDVRVTTESAATITDAKGRYELITSAGENRVRFRLDGYLDAFRSPTLAKGTPTQLDVTLLPRSEPVSIDAAEGGSVTGPRGAVVRIAPDAFIDASEKAVTGMVEVYLSPVDAGSMKERAAAPELVAEIGGDLQLLQSLGMIDIEVVQDDDKLELAPGKTLELSIPVPEGSDPEPSISLWSFDDSKDTWVRAGKASYDPDTRTYVGMVKTLALWNAAEVIEATCICGIVEEAGKGRIAGARVEASGEDYYGSSTAQTGADGRFCMAVGKNSDVEVTVYHASSGGESKQVHTKSDDTLIPPRSSDARCDDVGTWKVAKDD